MTHFSTDLSARNTGFLGMIESRTVLKRLLVTADSAIDSTTSWIELPMGVIRWTATDSDTVRLTHDSLDCANQGVDLRECNCCSASHQISVDHQKFTQG